MTQVRTILKSSAQPDGRRSVLLLVSDRGNRAYFSTGFSASINEFDDSKDVGRFIQGKGHKVFNVTRKEENGLKKSYSNKEANDKLAELENRITSILNKYKENGVSWSMTQLREDFVKAPKRNIFYNFAKDVLEKEYRAHEQYGKALIADLSLDSFMRFDSQFAKKSFQDITQRYLEDYIYHCRNILKHTDGTISIRLREIRRIFNLAIRDKVIPHDLYPFSSGKDDGKVKIPKGELNKTDQYLTLASMKKFANTTFEDPVLERTRHLFLFSYLCRGMNWRDMALLTKDNFYKATVSDKVTTGDKVNLASRQVTVMQYKRAKTRGEFDIQVTPAIQNELDWFRDNTVLYKNFVLPIVHIDLAPDKRDDYLKQVRKRFNKSLKKITEKLELPESERNISIYSARHSFAMTLQEKRKPVEIISQALGHKSVETTKHYLAKFSTSEMARETEIDLSE